MRRARFFIFEDGHDRLVFAPDSKLLLRTNAAKAAEFGKFFPVVAGANDIENTHDSGFSFDQIDTIVISCGNQCRLRCRYCVSDEHGSDIMPDAEFCRLALKQILASSQKGKPLFVGFLGVGEPTIPWERFVECVSAIEQVAAAYEHPLHMSICTDGQLSEIERDWLCQRMNRIDVSLDGQPEVHNRQRPRKDGCDAFSQPAKLIAEACAAERDVRIRTTVTSETVREMPCFVDYFSETFGAKITMVFTGMSELPGSPGGCHAPGIHDFITNFGKALDRGKVRSIKVVHSVISIDTLLFDADAEINRLVCLLPNKTLARHSEPFWLEDAKSFESSVFGRYDPILGYIQIDECKHRKTLAGVIPGRCRSCACIAACARHPSAWGWNKSNPGDHECTLRQGIALEVFKALV